VSHGVVPVPGVLDWGRCSCSGGCSDAGVLRKSDTGSTSEIIRLACERIALQLKNRRQPHLGLRAATASSSSSSLCQVDEDEPYGIACDGIKHFYSSASCVALVASKLKFTHEQGSELLVALEKKQVRPTSIDIHAHTPISYRPQFARVRRGG